MIIMRKFSCTRLRCCSLKEPLGLDSPIPDFSWNIWETGYETVQIKYRITVAETKATLNARRCLCWDTGETTSADCLYLPYQGMPLKSCTVYYWRIEAWDNYGNYGSGISRFETGLLFTRDWKAQWIEGEQEPAYEEPKIDPRLGLTKIRASLDSISMRPAWYTRRNFNVDKNIRRGRVYATARGVYNLEINGKKPGNAKLAPGYTAYDKLLRYQTYDITRLIIRGVNAVGMIIGDGWWCGKVGMLGRSCQYGNRTAALFRILLEYEDGSCDWVCSDGECKSSTGKITYADIFVGEKQDGRNERAGFSTGLYDDAEWSKVHVMNYSTENLASEEMPQVRIIEKRKPFKIYVSPKGETIIDTGQVMTGYLGLFIHNAERGREITLEYTETVDREGNYLNIAQGRFTIQSDMYICSGTGEEYFEPEFTFHGFRYVRLTGYPGIPKPTDMDVLVLGTDLEQTLQFQCSDERINLLQHNIFRSQRGNMISIPMDCPQRERQGWTGDAQIYSPTACFNMDMLTFFRSWLRNMRLEQKKDGQVPNIIPYIKAYSAGEFVFDTDSSSAWSDACIIIPWILYRAYGDIRVLRDNYEMMKRWISYVRNIAAPALPVGFDEKADSETLPRQRYIWNTGFQCADWLTPSLSLNPQTGEVNMSASAHATKHIVPTMYYAYTTALMSKIADELRFVDDAEEYHTLHNEIRHAFVLEFIKSDGRIDTDLQGMYVLGLAFDLFPKELRKKAIERLVSLIRANDTRLDTGFLSTRFLLDVLLDNEEKDMAFDILFQDECPSWFYEIKMGATTIWELWQAILPDGRVTSASFNHYAFGCVGDWIYRTIGGIQLLEPGFRKILFRPVPDHRISFAETAFTSVYGTIRFNWHITGNKYMYINAEIPPNCTGRFDFSSVWDGKLCLAEIDETCGGHICFQDGGKTAKCGSGRFSFVLKNACL
jgi:alpha-L-rhamnosidase